MATVKRLTGRLTVLSISHQPAMQEAADIVYQLNDGAARLLKADEPITTRQSIRAGSQT